MSNNFNQTNQSNESDGSIEIDPVFYTPNSSKWESESYEIPVTIEEPWNDDFESLLRLWETSAEKSEISHRRAGYRLKYKHNLLNFIIIVWASVILIASTFEQCQFKQTYKIVIVIINSIQLFLTSLNANMDLGNSYRKHFDFEVQYQELHLDIHSELARDRQYRVAADAYTIQIKERLKKLANAPEFPNSTCFFF